MPKYTMNDSSKKWAFIVLAFVAGFGASRFVPKHRASCNQAVNQADWKRNTRSRFSDMRERMGEEGRLGRPEAGGRQGKKGGGKRKKGEGGSQ